MAKTQVRIARDRFRRLRQLSHVVALGGGTGLPVVLRGLRRHLPRDCRITAVVTATDDGGSSGVLRDEYGVLPPGDLRNCLLALADVAPAVEAAFQYRFDGPSVPEHPMGNLLLTALSKVTGDDLAAVRLASALLGVNDVVLPATTGQVHLLADLVDGRSVRGESRIPRSAACIAHLRLDPPDARPAPGVLEALQRADLVILGPGSLYTSLIATLIIPGVVEAVNDASAVCIYVCNLMTEPGETDGYDVAAHLEALAAHGLPADTLDYIVVNSATIPGDVPACCPATRAVPVRAKAVPQPKPPIVFADVLDVSPPIRHAADKLGILLCSLAAGQHLSERMTSWP